MIFAGISAIIVNEICTRGNDEFTDKKHYNCRSWGTSNSFFDQITCTNLYQQEYDVKVSEIHGMSQRNGSVVTNIRYGEKVFATTIERGKTKRLCRNR